ncbi:MAG: Crp/Fnr family transcriptional regulator [Thermoleophilaceae bacterium]|jgi:CRP-like cAMP-binding protein
MTAQLSAVPLFADLPEEARTMIARSARQVRYAPGDEIVREKAFSFEFFAIAEGSATVLRGEERLAELGPGDFFGEMGVLPQGGLRWSRRNASVVASSHVDAIAIPGHEFRHACDELPELRDAILAAITAREKRASESV